MLKNEFVNIIHKKLNNKTKKEINEFIDAFVESLIDVLGRGGEVKLVNFGTFKMRKISAHKAINPITKEKTEIGDSFTPMFKISKVFKNRVIG